MTHPVRTQSHLTHRDLLALHAGSRSSSHSDRPPAINRQWLVQVVGENLGLVYPAQEHDRAAKALLHTKSVAAKKKIPLARLVQELGRDDIFYEQSLALDDFQPDLPDHEHSPAPPSISIPKANKRKLTHIMDLNRKGQYRRSQQLYDQFTAFCEEEGVSPSWLCDLFRFRALYVTNRQLARGSFGVNRLNAAKASFIQQHLMLGKGKYQVLKSSLSSPDPTSESPGLLLPSWKDLRVFQQTITPQISPSDQPGNCRKISFNQLFKFV